MIVVIDKNLRQRSVAYVGLALGLAALTLAVLASAALRLSLYLAAYGWTELRLWVAISIVAMAALLLITIVAIILDRVRWLGRALVALGLLALLSLSVVAPPAFVAARNVERAVDPRLVPPTGASALTPTIWPACRMTPSRRWSRHCPRCRRQTRHVSGRSLVQRRRSSTRTGRSMDREPGTSGACALARPWRRCPRRRRTESERPNATSQRLAGLSGTSQEAPRPWAATLTHRPDSSTMRGKEPA